MRIILLTLTLTLFQPLWCYADLILIHKPTGDYLIYHQKGNLGDLIKSGLNAGYSLDELEEREVTEKEWLGIKAAQTPPPVEEQEIPIEAFAAGIAGGLAGLAGKGLVVKVRKKKDA